MRSPPTLTFTCRHSPYPAIDASHVDRSMEGKAVLITGGGSGIGAAIAESFAQANASNIIIVGRTQSRLDAISKKITRSYKSRVHSYILDLGSEQDVQGFLESIRAEIGQIEILVLNASHLHEQSKITDNDFAMGDFWKCFDVNVKGNLSLTRTFIRQAPNNATIINITSFMEYLPPFPYPESGYASSKAAFTKVLDYLHAESPSLRIFNLHPGTVISDMLVKCGVDPKSEAILYDDPMLAGNVCVWLVTPKADFLNGRTIEAMWDVDEMERSKDIILADPRVLKIGLVSRGHVPLTKEEQQQRQG